MSNTQNLGMRRFLLIMILVTAVVNCCAQDRARKVRNKECPSFIFRVTLKDKQNSPYSLERPTRFLSKRSVDRRKKQGLPLDSTDLPVTPKYVRQIESLKTAIVGTSRWNNTVLAQMKDTSELQRIRLLPCVKDCRLVWHAPDSIQPTALKTKYEEAFNEWDSVSTTPYGRADAQIKSLSGHRLHDINCMGEGMMIAVLDGGFKNVDKIPAFDRVDIRGTRDFVYPASPSIFYELDHGTKVLSTMTIQKTYYYIGTAPKASYWLLRCEDGQSEQEVEEDYWAIAAEFADSVGCDLINSSLGYNDFDKGYESHKLWQLDGHSTLISHSASFVAKKGMILVNSAGNSGMGPWKKLTCRCRRLSDSRCRHGSVDERPFQFGRSYTGRTSETRCCSDWQSCNHCHWQRLYRPGYGYLVCRSYHLWTYRLLMAGITREDRTGDDGTDSSVG